MARHRPGDLFPPALDIAIAAVIYAPVSIPVVVAPFLGELGSLVLGVVAVIHPRQVIPRGRLVKNRHEIDVAHGTDHLIESYSCCTFSSWRCLAAASSYHGSLKQSLSSNLRQCYVK